MIETQNDYDVEAMHDVAENLFGSEGKEKQ